MGSIDYPTGYTYDLAGDLLTETYPSGHVATYNYDGVGRLADKDSTHLAFTGNLGDGTSRNYSSGIVYDEAGRMTEEKLGTDTPFTTSSSTTRGQLAEIRESTSYTGRRTQAGTAGPSSITTATVAGACAADDSRRR